MTKKQIYQTMLRSIIVAGLLVSARMAQATTSTYGPVAIGTNGSPRGYMEFLPGAYYDNPTQRFPVMIFLHGVGHGGTGSLTDVLHVDDNISPPSILRDALANTNPDNQLTAAQMNYRQIKLLTEQHGCIVLAPQYPVVDGWWSQYYFRPFLDFVVSHYRIDPRRIYLTGLSGGSGGVADFINVDSYADQATAALVVATRGSVDTAAGSAMGAGIPFWGLTAYGDSSNTVITSVNNIAGALLGSGPTNVIAGFEVPVANTNSASFHPSTGWTYQSGVDPSSGVNPKITLYPGSNHNSWDVTYQNIDCWTWMYSQIKPDVSITSPASGVVVARYAPVLFTAAAQDVDENVISDGNKFQWYSNLDGFLGTGTSLSVSSLGTGIHTITCKATDVKFRRNQAQILVTVPRATSFTANFDFGSATYLTSAPWNNVNDLIAGTVENATDMTGNLSGVRLEIVSRFDNVSSGVVSSALYPDSAQRDGMYVGGTNSLHAEMLISGLNPTQRYDFTFFGSRNTGGNRTGLYTINGNTVSLNAANNTSNTVSLLNVFPNAFGQVLISVEKDPAAIQGYLNVLSISTAGVPLENWRAAQFGANVSDSQIAGDGADPDKDGIANLMEYALGGDPNGGARTILPMTTIPVDRLQMGFSRLQPSDVSYVMEASPDLVNWTPIATFAANGNAWTGPATVNETGTGSTRSVTVQDTQIVGSGSKRFLRLKVTKP